ncbi:hypothetical protein RHMOL_Rhmol12G0191900 [Rhododendron molle]|nr:hypothetical protein RHMOL_Rhmol12G0191900 [Rhododendron molle]
MAAIRGAVSIGRKANSSLFPVPRYLRTRFHVPAASHSFHGPISQAHRPSGLKYPIRAIHEATVNPVAPSKDDVGKSPDNWKVKMLYDGECPLCMREVMGRIHAILSDGTVVTDVEAFRKLYEAVDLGWVYAITKYKPVGHLWRKFWRHERTRVKHAMTARFARCKLSQLLLAVKNKGS